MPVTFGEEEAPVPPNGFELLGRLGAAGAGSDVWTARCVALGDTVALKWASEAGAVGADRLAAEATHLGAVDHPHVVRCYDLVTAPDGRPVLVLEHAGGGSLADVLAHGGPLRPGEVARIGAGVAAGLAAVHRAGLVHGDVRPSNVLLGDHGRPLLADLGAAVPAGAPSDQLGDVLALGRTMHEALTGVLPGAAPPSPPGPVDLGFEEVLAVVLRAASACPADRPPSAADLGTELLALAPRSERVRVPPPHVPVPLRTASGAAAPPDEGGAGLVGARADAAPPASRGGGRRQPLVGLGAGVLTALVLASLPLDLRGTAGPGRDQACPPLQPRPGEVMARLERDGCPVALAWDGRVLTVPGLAGVPARYALGQPGDTLLFGDWDCDGADTPALHRTATGEVVVFDRLPLHGVPEPGRTTAGRPGGTVVVGTGADGCDAVMEVG